jgi:hypothetical protein
MGHIRTSHFPEGDSTPSIPIQNTVCPLPRQETDPHNKEMIVIHFLINDDNDTATRLMGDRVTAGQQLQGWMLSQGCFVSLRAGMDLPAGSLVALRDLLPGSPLIVLGRRLGAMQHRAHASEPIPTGAWCARKPGPHPKHALAHRAPAL